jgi:hypothetical protein
MRMGEYVSEREFEENAGLFAAGQISRRRFINRLVAGGASMVAAVAFVNASSGVAFAAPGSGSSGALYGTPPGQGGTPPGQGGTPPPFAESPPGQGGTPPGQGGTPPGYQRRRHFR